MITQYGSEKENKILSSALELFVEKGFHGTSTSAISKRAGVSTGILFHYFSTKEELITKLFFYIKSEFYKNMISNIDLDIENIEASLKDMWLDTITWINENKLGFRFINQFHYSPFYTEYKNNREILTYDNKANDFFKLGIESGYFVNINIDLMRNNIYNLVVSFIEVIDHLGYIDEDLIEQGFNCALASVKKV